MDRTEEFGINVCASSTLLDAPALDAQKSRTRTSGFPGI